MPKTYNINNSQQQIKTEKKKYISSFNQQEFNSRP